MAKTPLNRDTVKKLLDTLTPMNPDTAEKFVQDLLRIADERRRELERVVGDVAKVGVRTAEGLATSVQHELGRQITKMAARIDDLERQVETLNKALEATRANLLNLASRTLAKGSEEVDSSVSPSKKAGKGGKKAMKKAEKTARRSKANSTVPATVADGEQSDGSAAVAGI